MKAALLHRTLITSVVCTLPALSGLHAIEPLPVSVTAPADLRVVEGAAAGDLLFLLTSGGGSSTSFDVALTPGSEGALVALSQPDAEAPNGIRVDAAPSTPWTGALLLPGNAGTLTGQADLTGVTAGQTASFGVELSHADWNGTSTASTNINVVANRKLTGSATINAGRHMIGAEYTIGTLTLSGGSATDSEATRITVHENGYAQFSNGLRLSATTGHTFDGAEQTHDVQISYTGTSGNYTISNFTLPGSGQSSYTDASGNARHDFGGNWYTEAEYGNVFGETRTIIRQSGDWVWGSGSKTIHSYDLVETSQPTVQYSVYEDGHNWYLDRGAGVSMNERVGALISGENIAGSDLDLSGVVLNIEGTALEDRTLTGGVVDLGRKLVGAGTETIQRTDTVAITTSGADDHYTRLQVAAFNTGDGSLQAEHLAPADFVNASSTANVNLTANFEIDRSHLGHGSYTLDVGSFISSLENGGAGLAGENTQDYLAIGYQWTTVQNNALISSNLMVIEYEGLTGERSYGSGDAVKQAYLTSTHTDIGYYHNAIVLNDTYSVGVHDLGEVTAWATPEGLEGEDVSGISTTFKVVTATLHHAEMAEIEVTGALSSGALGDGSVLTLRNAGSSVYHASAFVDLENVRITGADQLQFQLDYQGPRDTGDFSERLLYSGESSTLAISYSGSDVAGEMTRVYRGGLSFDLYESIYGVVERISDHALGGEYYEFVGDPLYINSNYIRTETYQLEHRVEAPERHPHRPPWPRGAISSPPASA